MPGREELPHSGFLVLLALADVPRHGLDIVDEVERTTSGRAKLGPGTLYGTLQRLEGMQLIEETNTPPDPSNDDPRRRYYRMTQAGRRALAKEADRLHALVDVAFAKKVLKRT